MRCPIYSEAVNFSIAVFLAYIFPDTLLPVSLYAGVVTLSAIVFGSSVGRLVDRSARLKAVRSFLVVQKLTIAVSAFALFVTSQWLRISQISTYLGFVVVCLCGVVQRLANMGMMIAVEKDWVVVLSRGRQHFLTRLNTHLRRIDLTCKVAAPLLVSAFSIKLSTPVVMLIVAAMSMCTIPIEWAIFTRVYRRTPALAIAKQPHNSPETAAPNVMSIREDSSSELPMRQSDPPSTESGRPCRVVSIWFKHSIESPVIQHIRDWRHFVHHEVFLSSLAIAQIYFTVLSFGPVMITFLLLQGYSSTLLAVMRFVAVFAGLSSTFAMPKMVGKIGLIRTGLWAIWTEFIFLIPVAVSFWIMDDKSIAGILLFTGAIASRLGLWTFDLAQTQIMQERVDITESGLINGMQTSLQNAFDFCAALSTIIWSDPSDFYIPACLSVAAVLSAAVTFSVYAARDRGHLFHFEKLIAWGLPIQVSRSRNRSVGNDTSA
ncbi:Ferroporti-1 [Phlyctochytrium arcticum]|nr:Ferroporti-1 [Phlyctochytrium arcticum]